MSQPITWQNVQGRSAAEASIPLAEAAKTFDNAFKSANTTLTNEQARRKEQYDRGMASQVLTLKEMLQNAKSPEEVAQLQPRLAQAVGGLSNEARQAMLGAGDARTTALQGQITDKNKFAVALEAHNQRKVVDAIGAAYAAGDYAAGDALKAANPDLANQAAIAKDRFAAEQERTKFGQATETFKEGLLNSANTRSTQTSNAAANTRNADTNAAQTPIHQQVANATDQRNRLEAVKQLGEAHAKAVTKAAETSKKTIGTEAGMKALGEIVTKMVPKDTAPKVMSMVAEAIRSNHDFGSIPTGQVEAIALKHSSDIGGPWNSMFGSSVSDIVTDLKKELDASGKTRSAIQAATDEQSAELTRSRMVLNEAQRQAYPDLTKAVEEAAATRARATGNLPPGVMPAVSQIDPNSVGAPRPINPLGLPPNSGAVVPDSTQAPTMRATNPRIGDAGYEENLYKALNAGRDTLGTAKATPPEVAIPAALKPAPVAYTDVMSNAANALKAALPPTGNDTAPSAQLPVGTPLPPQKPPGNVPLPMDGLGNSPQPKKTLGGFDAPASGMPILDKEGKPTDSVATPRTDSLKIDLGSGKVSSTNKDVPIPNIQWSQPTTVVKASPTASKLPGQKMVATYVGDGDSVSLKGKDGSSINCRVDSIDAPETAHPEAKKPGQIYGEDAKKTLQDMILNKEVTVKVTKPSQADKNYGRTSCQIEFEGVGIDARMIAAGAAWAYTKFGDVPRNDLHLLEQEAASAGRGLHANKDRIRPELFRKLYWPKGDGPSGKAAN